MILQQTLTQRVRICIDLEHAGPAYRGQQVQGVHQADRAAEIVRAEGPARRQRRPGNRLAAGMAAPFRKVGLEKPEQAGLDCLPELAGTTHVLAGGQAGWRGGGEFGPFDGGPIGHQRFLDPVQVELSQPRRHRLGSR